MRNGRQQPLGRGAGGRDQQLRLVALRLQRVQRRQPLGHHAQRRRGAVVGQAVPAGQGQHFDFGRKQRDRVGKRPHRRFVGDDHDRAAAFAVPCAARARSAASHGRKPDGTPARVSGSVGAEDALQRLAHRGDPDIVELLQRLDHRALRSARAASAVPCAQAMMSTSCSSSISAKARARPRPTPMVRIEEPADQQVGFLGAAMVRAPGEALQVRVGRHGRP